MSDKPSIIIIIILCESEGWGSAGSPLSNAAMMANIILVPVYDRFPGRYQGAW